VKRPLFSHAEPEARWLAEVAGGHRDAFRLIVEKHQQSILNLAYRFTGDKELSRDISQDILLKIYESAPRYRPEARFSTWLYRVAVNHCLNHLQ
jgi:RNA polymerase sigma-70 factor (ECF subfamily)